MSLADAIDWTPELTSSVLKDITEGSTLREAGKANGMSASAIVRRVHSDEEFAKQYARAMEIRNDADFDALMDEVRSEPETTKSGIDPAWVNLKRLQVDTLKWALSKRNPKKYGEKQQLEHGFDKDQPLVVKHIGAKE